MSPKEEQAYVRGERAAFARMLGEAARGLGHSDPLTKGATLLAQLEATRAALRILCEEHGDNDWDDDLHLADVVDKHLGKHLSEKARR